MNQSSFLRRAGLGLGAGLLATCAMNAQIVQTFVAVTPCRVLDTRLATQTTNGPLPGPSMIAGSTRSFPFPQVCGLPATAAAYSINVTVVPPTGKGLGYLTLFPTGVAQPVVSTLNDFQNTVVANAAIVPAGTNGEVSVYVTDQTDIVIDVNGYFVSNNSATTNNTSLGNGALPLGSGGQNTGIGASALSSNTTGAYNTATGATALVSNTTGSKNTSLGQGSMLANTTGSDNTAVGFQALTSEVTSGDNTALGYQAMLGATGNFSVAIGSGSLPNATGDNNIAIGYQSGSGVGTGGNNVLIANAGTSTDANLIRIGTLGTHTATYIAGLSGTNITGGAAVVVNGAGQVGVVSSSRRYKQDIQPMADSTDRLMQLEPVTFHYKQASPDGSQPLQFGLIAEQVAEVYPELAVYNQQGQVETLQYQQLPAMLLNEIQKQHRTIQDLENRIADLEKLIKAR